MYPDRDTLSNVPRSGYITVRDQSTVESGVTKGGKNTARSCQFSFSWMNTTTQTRSLKLKSKVIPEEKQQLVEEKDADNIRKVLCKSFIQWFWELNLCCYKYRVDCFGSLRLFSCCCWSESLETTLNVRSLRKPVSFVFPRVLMFPSTSSRETSGLSGKQN